MPAIDLQSTKRIIGNALSRDNSQWEPDDKTDHFSDYFPAFKPAANVKSTQNETQPTEVPLLGSQNGFNLNVINKCRAANNLNKEKRRQTKDHR